MIGLSLQHIQISNFLFFGQCFLLASRFFFFQSLREVICTSFAIPFESLFLCSPKCEEQRPALAKPLLWRRPRQPPPATSCISSSSSLFASLRATWHLRASTTRRRIWSWNANSHQAHCLLDISKTGRRKVGAEPAVVFLSVAKKTARRPFPAACRCITRRELAAPLRVTSNKGRRIDCYSTS